MEPRKVTHSIHPVARRPLVPLEPIVATEARGAVRKSLNRAVRKEERAQILAVLARAADDPAYIARLTYDPSGALEGYTLSQTARAALVCGDVRWVEAKVGKLDDRMRTWLDCRLQQEIW